MAPQICFPNPFQFHLPGVLDFEPSNLACFHKSTSYPHCSCATDFLPTCTLKRSVHITQRWLAKCFPGNSLYHYGHDEKQSRSKNCGLPVIHVINVKSNALGVLHASAAHLKASPVATDIKIEQGNPRDARIARPSKEPIGSSGWNCIPLLIRSPATRIKDLKM